MCGKVSKEKTTSWQIYMTGKTINVRINGKDIRINPDLTAEQLLAQLNINKKLVAVALNGVVIRRKELNEVHIVASDEIEIVRAVGGG